MAKLRKVDDITAEFVGKLGALLDHYVADGRAFCSHRLSSGELGNGDAESKEPDPFTFELWTGEKVTVIWSPQGLRFLHRGAYREWRDLPIRPDDPINPSGPHQSDASDGGTTDLP
jgi:hypothetical protein